MKVAFLLLLFLSLISQKQLFFSIPPDIFSHLIPELPKPLNFNSAPTLLLKIQRSLLSHLNS